MHHFPSGQVPPMKEHSGSFSTSYTWDHAQKSPALQTPFIQYLHTPLRVRIPWADFSAALAAACTALAATALSSHHSKSKQGPLQLFMLHACNSREEEGDGTHTRM